MKITNDVNSNTDFLSSSQKEDKDTSLLGSLFTINFNSNEIKSNRMSEDYEFVLKEDEIQIIEYLSNILPNLNTKNLEAVDFENIKSQIKSDKNIKTEIKDKILFFLDSAKNYNHNIFIKIPEHQNFKSLSNKIPNKYLGDLKLKNESLKVYARVTKSIEQVIDQDGQKSLKANLTTNNTGVVYSEDKFPNHKILNDKKNESFVKKINKNDHPNKLYQLSHSNSFKTNKKIDSTSLVDSKLSNNTNLNFVNNQLIDDLKKNKINEIKLNDKVSNIQSSFETGSKENQFSQQNHTSLMKNGFNSVLEGLYETLDLTQKGWTTRLVSRLEHALTNGGEEIEFNLKPKSLGKLKVSISFKNGIGNVKIITENSFVTNALTQNENHLQKLFNDQGIDLEFLAHDENQNLGSKNHFNKNSKSKDQNKFLKSESESEEINSKKSLDDTVSSRHIVNVIA